MAAKIDQLQKVQFDVIKTDITMSEREGTSSNNWKCTVKFLLQNNMVKTYNDILFTDALFQYITAASSLTNSKVDTFRGIDKYAPTNA